MKRIFFTFKEKYLNKELDFRVRLFNVLAMGGIAASLFASVTVIINAESFFSFITNFIGALLSFALMWYATKSGKFQHCYLLTIMLVFFFIFPMIFLSGGGYHGAMPSFFIFAVLFTVFMIDGKKAVLISILELVTYAGLCVYAYYYPWNITELKSEFVVMTDTIVGFVLAALILGFCMLVHFKMYNEQQRELYERNAELDRINQSKTEFLSNISHELKTPLTVVSSHIQIARQEVKEKPELEKLDDAMKLVNSEVERMSMMVSQLLDVSRIEERSMTIEKRNEDIVEIIQTTMGTYYPVFGKNRNKLIFQSEVVIPAVCCDRMRITQVLVNLIGNASRHTMGGVITVSVKMGEQEIVVTVSDTGEGIDAKRIPYLFERYYTSTNFNNVQKGRNGWDNGTGLGLFICRFIVEAHCGRIWIESIPGEGTDVIFTLPLDI